MIEPSNVILISLVLFSIGMVGMITRKDAITLFLCIEIMLNAANVAFVGFSKSMGQLEGHVAVIAVIVVAATEAAVALSLAIKIQKEFGTLNVMDISKLRN